MELREILKILDKNIKLFLISLVAGLAIGIIYFLVFPPKPTAIGTLVVSRKSDAQSANYFTYDGYYNQQTAELYAKTAAAILESDSLKKTALEKLNIQVSEKTLRWLSKRIKIRKPAPQVITLKTLESKDSTVLWNTLSKELIAKTQEVNKNGDGNITITKLGDPIVKSEFKPIWLCVLVAMFLAEMFTLIFVVTKSYLNYSIEKKR